MRKITLALAFVLFAVILTNAQDKKLSNRERADHYLESKGEVCFSFKANSEAQFKEISQFLSIGHKHVNKDDLIVEAYANSATFDTFLEYGLPYQVKKEDNELPFNAHAYGANASVSSTSAWDTTWDLYPRYSEYVAKMNYYATTYPNLCSLQSIGTTQSGRELLVLKISDNIATNEGEPQVFYTSTMHGDELVGFPLMIRLIDYLLTNYGSDTEATNLVNTTEIYINPNANPDGSYRLGDTDLITNPIRANDSGQDLNRNYPDNVAGLHYEGTYEDETLAFMDFAKTKNFVLSANFHGGTEVFNYPYDNEYYSDVAHPDNDYYEFIGIEYASNAQADSPSGYMDVDYDSSLFPSPGVTRGAEWYLVYGGRQDFMNYYHNDKEVTIELSDVKWVSPSNLPAHWNYNKQALLDFIKQANYGLHGTVTDESGNPIVAKIEISGHDRLNTFRKSEPELGTYHKLLKAGNYNVTYSAPGYVSQTIPVTITDYQKTTQNVTLVATTANPSANDEQLCDSGSATLNATGNGTINWYDSIDSTTPIASGNSFTTPTLNTTTYYYVEDVISKANVGSLDSDTNGAYYNTSGRYLIFDCTESVMLKQVTVNAQNAGELEIELQNNLGEVLDSRIVLVNSGIQAIDLDFMVPVANDLRLVGKDISTGGLYRNNSNVSFPYTNGSINVKDSSAGTSYYYFFYDWKIGDIKSARQEVAVNVLPSPTAGFTYTVTDNTVTFTNTSSNATTYSWDFGDTTGSSTSENPMYTFAATGTYNVVLTATNTDCGDDTITIPVTVATLNVDDNVLAASNIYPNPFKNSLTLNLPTSVNGHPIEATLLDLRGRIILTMKINHQNTLIMNTKSLANGSYFLRIKDVEQGTSITKKLIKD